jgi:nucleotide-binding universal stress UspA family protein
MHILCPIDFSEHSLYALDYAIRLGNALGARLHLFTAYSVPHSTGRLRSLDGEIKKSVMEDLAEVLDKISPKITTGEKPLFSVREGNSGRAISEFSRNNDIDFIVMGTQGKGSLSNIFLGSVAKKVVDNASVPVIAVPQPLKEGMDENTVVLNVDEKTVTNDVSLNFVSNFVKKLNLRLDVFHAISGAVSDDKYKDTVSKLGDIVRDVKTENSDNITESIKLNAENNNYSLIMMIRRPHSFWSRLFMDTHTTTELAMTRIPIMILPE